MKTRAKGSITAVVVSCNEGNLLERCLASVAFVDAIVVGLMACSDESQRVASSFGATTVEVPREPLAERVRNRLLELVETEWVYFVDPDEIVPRSAAARIRKRCLDVGEDVAGFRVPLQVYGFGRPLVHTFPGIHKASVFRVGAVTWPDDPRTHTDPIVAGELVLLGGDVEPVQNHSFTSVQHAAERLLRYASNGMFSGLTDGLLDPFVGIGPQYTFVVRHEAWRDGVAGVVVASLYGFEVALTMLFDWERAGYPELDARRARWLVRLSRIVDVASRSRSFFRRRVT